MAKKPFILVADDDPGDHAKFIRAVMEVRPDLQITSMTHGMQLVDYMQALDRSWTSSALPDLIITDLYMPFAGGLQVLKQIRKISRLKNIPVYVFSTNYDKTIRARVIESGATMFYRKPGQYEELENIIRGILCGSNTASESASAKSVNQ